MLPLDVAAGLTRAFLPVWRGKRPDGPIRGVVALTCRCNMRCRYCRSWDKTAGKEWTPNELSRLFRQMPRLVWLDVTGGEIFARRDAQELLVACVESARQLKVFHFATNGFFADRVVEAVRAINRRRPDLYLPITVSIDGPPDIHDKLRGRDGSYVAAIECVRRLRAIPGAVVHVGTTVGPDNWRELPTLRARLGQDLDGFDDRIWHWNLVQRSAHFFGNADQEMLALDVAARLVRDHLRNRFPPSRPIEIMEALFLVNLEAHLRGEPVGIHCQALWSSCFVSADCVLYPCHVYDRPLADLRAIDFDVPAVWHAGETIEARADAVALRCGGCFTPCEAYTTLVGSPVAAVRETLRRLALMRPGSYC